MKLTCMRGYSGSGKSTKAAEIAKETGAVIVNRDYLRKMLLGKWWTGNPTDEESVTIAEENLVGDFLTAGNDVIVDATHLNPRYLRKWARLATKLGADFEVVDVWEPLAVCLYRNNERRLKGERAVEDKVIHQQVKQWPEHKWPEVTADKIHIEPYVPKPDTPTAVIVDIDGTLAHIPDGGRSPYDYSQVTEDEVDPVIRGIVNKMYDEFDRVIILSGRDSTCYVPTAAWLQYHGVKHDMIYMRPPDAKDERGGKLPDWIVKLGLFNTYIRDHYDVQFVLDDRKQVVDMWRKLGLKCLQVAEGNF